MEWQRPWELWRPCHNWKVKVYVTLKLQQAFKDLHLTNGSWWLSSPKMSTWRSVSLCLSPYLCLPVEHVSTTNAIDGSIVCICIVEVYDHPAMFTFGQHEGNTCCESSCSSLLSLSIHYVPLVLMLMDGMHTRHPDGDRLQAMYVLKLFWGAERLFCLDCERCCPWLLVCL